MKILNLNIILVILLTLHSCSSVNDMDTQKMQKDIIKIDKQLNDLNYKLENSIKKFKTRDDIEITISNTVLNEIFSKLSNYNNIDLKITLLPTKGIYKKHENVLGISYTNYVNVDSGFINIDIKSIKIINQINNELKLLLELYGTGNVYISGKNFGITASISSKIDAYTKDTIGFKVKSYSNNIKLIPQNNGIDIKTKFTISLFGWDLPWRETISLNFSEIMQPLEVPININPRLDFPLPDYTDNKLTFKKIPVKIKINKFDVLSNKQNLKIKSNLEFVKK